MITVLRLSSHRWSTGQDDCLTDEMLDFLKLTMKFWQIIQGSIAEKQIDIFLKTPEKIPVRLKQHSLCIIDKGLPQVLPNTFPLYRFNIYWLLSFASWDLLTKCLWIVVKAGTCNSSCSFCAPNTDIDWTGKKSDNHSKEDHFY